MQLLYVPDRLTLKNTLNFVNQISDLNADEPIKIDFSFLDWAKPFGMLYIAQAVKSLRERFPESKIISTGINFDKNATSYGAHMGLFRSCGFEYGNDPGYRTKGNSTYLPITYVSVKQLRSHEAIEDLAMHLARQLIHDEEGVIVDTLSYSFREMIRNVVEHSFSDTLGYCAQYWPKKGKAELAILDTGIGITKSLSNNPHLKLSNDKDAVKYSLMPGISGTTFEGVKLRDNDVWQNSGYGLYMNYRLCNEGGSFFICSGNAGLYRTGESDNVYHKTNFQGTALCLEMNTRKISNIQRLLQQFAEDGGRIAERVGMGAIPTASTMSKMLKDNFKELPVEIQLGDTVRHRRFGDGTVKEKFFDPQGEMLWITFTNGRNKKILSKDVIVVNLDTETYQPIEGLDYVDDDQAIDEFVPTDDSSFEDTDFEFFWEDDNQELL